ncbi:MAG: hypothetical protein HPY50_08645 [Firmicutes bacterium]|nr:hypothetical protein [Bacillota bacterium]
MAENKPDNNQVKELISLSVMNSIDVRYSSGPMMGKWFEGFKDKKLYASKCPQCGRTQTPPSESCPRCAIRTEEVVEVGPEGIICEADIFYFSSPDPLTGYLRPTPYNMCIFKLDNASADDAFAFTVRNEDNDKLKRGVRVRAVWNEVRTGSVADLLHFKVIDD